MNQDKPGVLDLNADQEDLTAVKLLNKYQVPVTSQDEIRELCDIAGSYLPQKQSYIMDLRFWKIAFFEMTGKSALFWMCCAVAISIGAALIQTAISYFSPLMVMMALAPVPFLAFVIDALHYRDPHVVELEMTCRYDAGQLYIAKLLIGMLFNIALIVPAVFAVSSVYADVWRLTLSVFATMFFVGFLALMLIGKTKSSLSLSAFLVFWVIAGGMVFSLPEVAELFANISMAALAAAFGTSLILFTMTIIRAAQHMRQYAETGGCHL